MADELETSLSIVEKLEAYEPKSYLMTYNRIDNAGLAASFVREIMRSKIIAGTEWNQWKLAIQSVAQDKSWPELAEMIYGDMF